MRNPGRWLIVLAVGGWVSSTAVFGQPMNVTFYAGFEGSLNASSAAGSPLVSVEDVTPALVPGFRGQAVRCGARDGNLRYVVEKNLYAPEGTIEMQVCPVDWAGADHQMHVFFRAEDPGWLQLYKYPTTAILFLTSADRKVWSCAQSYLGVELKKNEWTHLVATWKEGEVRLYFNGKEHPGYSALTKWIIPRKVSGFFALGDARMEGQGGGTTLIDEFYVYGRALSPQEVAWVVREARTRTPGRDVPAGIEPVFRELRLDTDLTKRLLVVRAELNPRYADQNAEVSASVVTPGGRAVEGIPTVLLTADRRCFTGSMPYDKLSKGTYTVNVTVSRPDRAGQDASVRQNFDYPGDGSEWRHNQVGLSDTPPPPWTPIQATKEGFLCWGREYSLEPGSFLKQAVSVDQPLLVRPIQLMALSAGQPVVWKAGMSAKVTEDAKAVSWVGTATGTIGELTWRTTAEFDGFIRYDVCLQPRRNAQVDRLELRFPVKPEHARYYYADSNFSSFHKFGELYGLTPVSAGEFVSTDHALYCFLGDDDRGLQVSIPSDEPWQEVDRKGMVRLERTADSVDIVWSFAEKPWTLPHPWKFSFAVQATPVKDCAGWRKWRFSRQAVNFKRLPKEEQTNDLTSGIHYIYSDNSRIFDGVVPQPDDPESFRAVVDQTHAGGEKYIQYLLTDYTSPKHPVWRFCLKQYYNEECDGYWVSCFPSSDWNDWHVSMVDRFLRDYDQDGLYYDLSFVKSTGGRYGKTSDIDWYMRDGVRRKVYSLFESRELYKRLYTACKDYGRSSGKDTYIIAHAGTHPFMAIHGFSDMAFQGEDIKDAYEKNVPLDLLRVRGLSQSLGTGAFWLPQRQHFEKNRVEQSYVLMGRLLLQDVQVWNTYIDEAMVFEVYDAQNRFGGIVDAELLPYWRNGSAIAGQTDTVKASAYRKPGKTGGSLITVTNLADREQEVVLTLDPAQLHASSAGRVTQMMRQGAVKTEGNRAIVRIPRYSFVMFEIK